MVKSQYPNSIVKGKDLFDISLFRETESTSIFCTFMSELYSRIQLANITETHKFIKALKRNGKLVRCYTQNIDGIERCLGLKVGCGKRMCDDITDNHITQQKLKQNKEEQEEKEKELFSVLSSSISQQHMTTTQWWKQLDVVQLHGDINTLTCTMCSYTTTWSKTDINILKNGEVPICPICENLQLEKKKLGKRCPESRIGFLRPNIVLYGESHPAGEEISKGLVSDLSRFKSTDVFLIIGTSLKVDGIKSLVKSTSKKIHENGGIVILINRTSVSFSAWHKYIDYFIEADCDDWVQYLKNEIPDLFLKQTRLDLKRNLKKSKCKSKSKSEKEQLTTPPSTPSKIRVIKEGIISSETETETETEPESDFKSSQDSLLQTPSKRTRLQSLLSTPRKSPRAMSSLPSSSSPSTRFLHKVNQSPCRISKPHTKSNNIYKCRLPHSPFYHDNNNKTKLFNENDFKSPLKKLLNFDNDNHNNCTLGLSPIIRKSRRFVAANQKFDENKENL